MSDTQKLSAFRFTLRLLMGVPGLLLITALARFAPKALIWFLKTQIRRKDGKIDRKSGISQESVGLRLWLAFYEKTAWHEVKPLLERTALLRDRTFYANSFACLYWRDERFDEATCALKYWNTTTLFWIDKNPDEARKARRTLRKIGDWRFRPLQGEKHGDWLEPDKYRELSLKVSKSTFGYVMEWRKSCVAIELLKWSAERKHEPAREVARYLRQKCRFYYFESLFVNYELVRLMGLNAEEFDALCKNCER